MAADSVRSVGATRAVGVAAIVTGAEGAARPPSNAFTPRTPPPVAPPASNPTTIHFAPIDQSVAPVAAVVPTPSAAPAAVDGIAAAAPATPSARAVFSNARDEGSSPRPASRI